MTHKLKPRDSVHGVAQRRGMNIHVRVKRHWLGSEVRAWVDTPQGPSNLGTRWFWRWGGGDHKATLLFHTYINEVGTPEWKTHL